LLTFGNKEDYKITDRDFDSSELFEKVHFLVETIENIFLKIMKLQKISVYLLFAQLYLLTIKYLDSMELLRVITLQLSASIICINVTNYSEVKYYSTLKRVTKIEFIAMI
jgi:hypothetical protein